MIPASFHRAGVWPVFGVFFLEAFVLGNWIPRIPDIKTQFDFSASQLGFSLFMLSLGTLFAFVFVGWIIRTYGVSKACMFALPAWTLFVFIAPLAPDGIVLGSILLLAGISVGVQEVAMNTAAEDVAKRTGIEIMSRAHGSWSVGSLIGALTGTAFAALHIDVWVHFLVLLLPVVLISVWTSARIISSKAQSTAREGLSGAFSLPDRSIVLLCLMPIGIMLVEGAFIDWSAVFVQTILMGGPIATGLIYSAFSLVMAIVRLSGDWLVARYTALRIARISAVSATAGITIFALASNTYVAFLGALFSGLGVAIVYPIAVTAAARRPGNAEDNVAALSLFAFCSFMLAPPLIGFVADWIGLRLALLIIMPLAASSYWLSSELIRKETTT